MNVLDWVCLGIIVLLAIRCLVRGFVAEVLSVAAYVVGAAASLLLYKQAGGLILARFPTLPLPEVLAFVVVFALGFLLTRLLGKLLKEGLEAANLAVFDRLGGFILGCFEGLVAVSIILLVMQTIGGIVDTSKLLGGSVFAKAILPIVGPEVSKAIGGNGKLPTLRLPEAPKGGLPQSPILPVKKP
jgi:membrane protein required for colicin V production